MPQLHREPQAPVPQPYRCADVQHHQRPGGLRQPCGFTSWIEDRWAQMHQNTGLITRHEHRAGIVKSCQAGDRSSAVACTLKASHSPQAAVHAPLVPRLVRVVHAGSDELGVTCSVTRACGSHCRWNRQQKQSWQPCRYERTTRSRWRWPFKQTVHFRHDGTGLMHMQVGDQATWTTVQARWVAERTLCWNDVCARGDIPLD